MLRSLVATTGDLCLGNRLWWLETFAGVIGDWCFRVLFVGVGFCSLGFLLALAALGVDLKNITIIGGAFGVGIGFGLQTIVNNFICGIILLFERPIKVGDYVELGGQWAEIKVAQNTRRSVLGSRLR